MHLNRWHLLGIVLSVVWVTGGYWVMSHKLSEGIDASYANLATCQTDPSSDDKPWTKESPWHRSLCDQKFHRETAEWVFYFRLAMALFVFAPIPIAWLIAYWVRRGFRAL
jgi:hypothetical protein